MLEYPVELKEVLIEEPNNSCNICFDISETVKRSPCVCKTLYVCEECLRKIQNDSMICTVCRTRFEMKIGERSISTLEKTMNAFIFFLKICILLGFLLLFVFIIGIFAYSLDQGEWPSIVPEMFGTIFLYGTIPLLVIGMIYFCRTSARR